MALDSTHPQYADMRPDWDKMRDVYRGERHVKEQGTKYLPPTKGMLLDGYGQATASGITNVGNEAYEAYKLRAVLPDYVEMAVEVFIGLLHSQDAQIELPEKMEPLREKITPFGESLELLLRRINVEQLITGRLGLLLDLPKNPDPANPLPFIALYIAEACINWDNGEGGEGTAALNLVVLDESGPVREQGSFEWKTQAKHRVLELPIVNEDKDTGAVSYGRYRQGVFTGTAGAAGTYAESDMGEPNLRGTFLDEIPFLFVNTSDTIATPDKPPMLGLANACLTIYRGEADYRQNLFMQGQDTLVVVGDLKRSSDANELAASVENEPLRTGAGSMIHLEAAPGAGAQYAGVSADGLSEQRTALENDRKRAEAKSGALSSDNASEAESGEALKTRVAARTASLNQIAKTGAAALEWMLKLAAKWMGADPDKVKVTPNLEFADFQLTGENLAKIMAAKAAGAPLSKESIHRLMAASPSSTTRPRRSCSTRSRPRPRRRGRPLGATPLPPPLPPRNPSRHPSQRQRPSRWRRSQTTSDSRGTSASSRSRSSGRSSCSATACTSGWSSCAPSTTPSGQSQATSATPCTPTPASAIPCRSSGSSS
jgi:hypothetical protein